MEQNTVAEQGWEKIQSRVDQLVSQFLKEDYPVIDYKPKKEIALLQMPARYRKERNESLS
jgi:hypothetical protein